jgi:hypothetical protein
MSSLLFNISFLGLDSLWLFTFTFLPRIKFGSGFGEMAVVVCGSPGLVQRTRNAVVKISDDRAVHKGTGAQGIYVHAEAFGYA